MTEMTRKFHQEIQSLADQLAEMAAEILPDVKTAVAAVKTADSTGIAEVAEREAAADDNFQAVNSCAQTLLTLQQPFATDMRALLAILRLSVQIDRTSRLTFHIAEIALGRDGSALPEPVGAALDALVDRTIETYELAIESFRTTDDDRAARAIELANVSAELATYHGAIEEALTDPPVDVELIIELGLVGRHLQRIAHHARVMADQTLFLLGEETVGAT